MGNEKKRKRLSKRALKYVVILGFQFKMTLWFRSNDVFVKLDPELHVVGEHNPNRNSHTFQKKRIEDRMENSEKPFEKSRADLYNERV